MKRILSQSQGKIIAFALSGAIASGCGFPSLAQVPANSRLDSEPIVFFAPDLTRRGRPGGRRGAASRGGCQTVIAPEQLVALVPKTAIGKTVEEYPTVWLSIPFSSKDFHSLEFILNDSNGKMVYETLWHSTETLPGLVSFTLPPTIEPLEVGRTYDWYVTVYCQNPEQVEAESIFVGGSIVRVAPSAELQEDLTAATTERGKAVALARHGVWYDALAAIGKLQTEDSARTDWQHLLAAIGLDELASQLRVDCCRSSEQSAPE